MLFMGQRCGVVVHEEHACSCAHVAQEKRSPPEQQPSSGRRLTRGHSMPLLSAIHHLHGYLANESTGSTTKRKEHQKRHSATHVHLPCMVLLQVESSTGISLFGRISLHGNGSIVGFRELCRDFQSGLRRRPTWYEALCDWMQLCGI